MMDTDNWFVDVILGYKQNYVENPNNRMKEKRLDITYPYFLQNKFSLWMWKKVFCPKGFHLFDEVQSVEHHYLSCDACEYTVNLATSNEIPE